MANRVTTLRPTISVAPTDLVYQGLRIVIGFDSINLKNRVLIFDAHSTVVDDYFVDHSVSIEQDLEIAKERVRDITCEWAIQSIGKDRLLKDLEGYPIAHCTFDPKNISNLSPT